MVQGAFRHVRLNELNSNEMLSVVCRACGHRRGIAVAEVPAQINRGLPLAAIETQLRCRACGHRGRASLTVMRLRR